MTYLSLLWTFFKIGLFTIGGGYAMLPLIRQEIVGTYITEQELLNIIAVSESTPGPFAINLATFIGMQVGSADGVGFAFLASAVSVIGVVLPSFIILLIVSVLLSKFKDNKIVSVTFRAVRPVVVGLIASAVIILLTAVILPDLSLTLISFSGFNVSLSAINLGDFASFDYLSLALFAVFAALSFVKIKGKTIHPLILIGISAVSGVLLFGVIQV